MKRSSFGTVIAEAGSDSAGFAPAKGLDDARVVIEDLLIALREKDRTIARLKARISNLPHRQMCPSVAGAPFEAAA